MRVLVTGAGGQVGHDLVQHCVSQGDEVIGLDPRRNSTSATSTPSGLRSTRIRPEVVVNAAAWTAVDACETNPERAFRDNAEAVGWLRHACDASGAHLVHISTDYVFDGTLDRPYREDDATNPLSVYGASKLAGELAAGSDGDDRPHSWVCGVAGSNMVKTVLRHARRRCPAGVRERPARLPDVHRRSRPGRA